MPTQSGSAASHDGIEHLAMRPGKVGSMLVPEAAAGCADDVGHLQGGAAHRLIFFLERFTVSGLQTAIASIGLAMACKCRRDR